jgi:hypothetical protein
MVNVGNHRLYTFNKKAGESACNYTEKDYVPF